LGLVAGATLTGLIRVATPAIAAGAASMALSELVRDNANGWREVVAMGVAWTAMAALPIGLATVLAGWALWGAVAVWLVLLGAVMSRGNGGWARTYGSLLAVAVVTVAVALLVGA
jgi:hypothetical protein